MARTDTLGHFLTDVADAIRTKTGSADTIQASSFDTAIENIPSGGGTIQENDVNFYDYDGTLLYSYTKQQFLALEAMPENPTHSGLTSQGWNWSLSGAKTHVTSRDILDVGQLYVTDDNKTRLYVSIKDYNIDPTLCIGLNGTATIDWGDGHTDTITGTSTSAETRQKHIYSNTGNYVITIDCDTTFVINPVTHGGMTSLLDVEDTSARNYNQWHTQVYLGSIYKIEFGSTASFNQYYGLSGLSNLEVMTVPSTLTRFSNQFFNYMYKLKHITFAPNFVADMNMLSTYAPVQSISFGEGSTSLQDIGNPSIASMRVLKRLVLPTGFSSIVRCGGCNVLSVLSFDTSVTAWAVSGNTLLEDEIDLSAYTNLQQVSLSNTIARAIKLPASVTRIGTSGTSSGYGFQACRNLASIDLSNLSQITDIGQSAFADCVSVRNIILPPNLTTLAYGCFTSCNSLEAINIPQSVTSISDRVFINCYSLKHLSFPSSIPRIGSYCFGNCYSMEYYDFSNNTEVPTLVDKNAFSNIPNDCKIIVPDSLYNDWVAANNWSDASIVGHIIKKTDWDNL